MPVGVGSGWHELPVQLLAVCWPLAAFGGLVRDPIGSTLYWERDGAVMRLIFVVVTNFIAVLIILFGKEG